LKPVLACLEAESEVGECRGHCHEDAVTLALIGKVLGFVAEEFGEGLEALGDVSKAGYWVCQSILRNQGQGGVSLVELGKDALGVGPDIKAGVASAVGVFYT